jgi:hypothetical protein
LHEDRTHGLVVTILVREQLVLLEYHEEDQGVVGVVRAVEEISLEFNDLILGGFRVPLIAVHGVELAFRSPLDDSHAIAEFELIRVGLEFLVVVVLLGFKPASDDSDFTIRVLLFFLDETGVVLREIVETQHADDSHAALLWWTLRHHHAFFDVFCGEHVHFRNLDVLLRLHGCCARGIHVAVVDRDLEGSLQ